MKTFALRQATTRLLASVLILAITGLGLAAVYQKLQHGHLLSVQTESMVPAIPKGSLVGIQSVANSNLAVGDAITFVNPNNSKQTITHRIVELPGGKHPGAFITKGDANPTTDAPIPVSKIVGKVQWHVPYAGKAIDLVRKPVGLLLLIYIPALVMIVGELRNLSAYYKKQQPYMDAAVRERRRKGVVGSAPPEVTISNLIVPIMLGGLLILGVASGSAYAYSTVQLKLSGNVISAVSPVSAQKGVLIRKVELLCSRNNTLSLSKSAKITLYNSSRQRVAITGWGIYSQNGAVTTFNRSVSLAPGQSKVVVTKPFSGLVYAGDYLVLKTSSGATVDGLSWGLDQTQFSPSISAAKSGVKFSRTSYKQDTNTAADWRADYSKRCCDDASGTIDDTLRPLQDTYDDSDDGHQFEWGQNTVVDSTE